MKLTPAQKLIERCAAQVAASPELTAVEAYRRARINRNKLREANWEAAAAAAKLEKAEAELTAARAALVAYMPEKHVDNIARAVDRYGDRYENRALRVAIDRAQGNGGQS